MATGAEADVLRADDNRFEGMRKEDWTALDDDLTQKMMCQNAGRLYGLIA